MLSRDQFSNNSQGVIERYKRDNPIHAQFLRYGHEQGSSSDEFLSKNSKSGHQWKVFGDYAVSLSTSDLGIGVEKNGSNVVDSFGLYQFHECGTTPN